MRRLQGAGDAQAAGIAWGGLLLVALGHAAVDFYMGVLPPLMPQIVKQLGLSLTLGASIMSIASTLSSFSQPLFGYLIDRGGRNWLMVAAVVWTGAFVSALSFAHSYWAVVALALLGSIGSAFYHPLGSANASGLAGEGNRGLAMSIYSTGGSLGYALAPLAMAPLLATGSLGRLPSFFAVAAVCAVGMAAARVHAVPAPGSRRADNGHFAAELLAGWRQLLLVVAVVSLRAWSQTAITYLVPFRFEGRGANLLLTLFLLAATAGGMVGGFISDRIGRKATLIASSALAMPLFWLGAAADGQLSWLGLILGGAVLNAAFPATIVFAQELVPSNAGFASGLTMGLSWGIGALGLTLTGRIGDLYGLKAAFMLDLVLLAAAVLLSLPLRMRRNSQHTAAAAAPVGGR